MEGPKHVLISKANCIVCLAKKKVIYPKMARGRAETCANCMVYLAKKKVINLKMAHGRAETCAN